MPPRLTLYTRPRCKLCDEARRVLDDVRERLAPTTPLEIESVDITLSPSLWETYRYDVPVVLLDGRVLFRHRIDVEALEAQLLDRHRTP